MTVPLTFRERAGEKQANQNADPVVALTPAEAAKYLEVGLPYVYTLLHSGKLPGTREDGRWRIHKSDLDAWRERTANRRKKPPSDATDDHDLTGSGACAD